MTADELRQAAAQAIHDEGNCSCDAVSVVGDYLPIEVQRNRSIGDVARAALAAPVVADAFTDAARLRSLAAMFAGELNRGQTYTGAQVAAMLNERNEE